MSNGGIIYALVARGTCVLAEFTTTSGNFTTVTRRILEKIPREDAKMSYVYDSHVFHYVVAHGITYMCMADADFGRGVPFAFLDDITRRWSTTYGERGQTALAYGMNADFSRVSYTCSAAPKHCSVSSRSKRRRRRCRELQPFARSGRKPVEICLPSLG